MKAEKSETYLPDDPAGEIAPMVYRAIDTKTAQWIGMAASVAGGYVAVDLKAPQLYAPQGDDGPLTYDPDDPRANLLVMRVPATAGLATEGREIPADVLRELRPQLAAAGYAIDS